MFIVVPSFVLAFECFGTSVESSRLGTLWKAAAGVKNEMKQIEGKVGGAQ